MRIVSTAIVLFILWLIGTLLVPSAATEPVPVLATDTLPVVDELKTAPIIAVTPEQ